MAYTIISSRDLEDGVYKVAVSLLNISPVMQAKLAAAGLPYLDLGGEFSGLVTPKSSNRLRLRVVRGLNGPGIDAQLRPVVANGVVTSVDIVNQGTGYDVAVPVVQAVGGAGLGFTATLTTDLGRVTAVTITNGGSGYTPDATQVDFELPTRLRRIPVDLPVSEVFSTADWDDAELRAILWQDVITKRLDDMLADLRDSDLTITDTKVING